jgi:hypothetical protein
MHEIRISRISRFLFANNYAKAVLKYTLKIRKAEHGIATT